MQVADIVPDCIGAASLRNESGIDVVHVENFFQDRHLNESGAQVVIGRHPDHAVHQFRVCDFRNP
jgi:hypothetical protein